MTAHVEQVHLAPSLEKEVASCQGVVTYTLTSAANGTELTGTGDVCVVTPAASGYFRVSDATGTKAAAATHHRCIANVPRLIGGVKKGDFISYLDDA